MRFAGIASPLARTWGRHADLRLRMRSVRAVQGDAAHGPFPRRMCMPQVRDRRATDTFERTGHRQHQRSRWSLRQGARANGNGPATLVGCASSRLRLLHAPDAAAGGTCWGRTSLRVARAGPTRRV